MQGIKHKALTVSSMGMSDENAPLKQAERPRDERQVEMPNEETPGSSSMQDVLPTIPNIRLRETETNLWEVVMTEEEKELIAEFLEG